MEEQNGNDYLKGAVEALLFISDKPVEMSQIKEAIGMLEHSEIRQLIVSLQKDYEDNDRGVMIREIAGGYQMLTNPQYAEYVRNFFKTRVKEKLSRPALEALAITAYRQPVSRADVEMIRGVNSDGVVMNLLEKGLMKIVGRKDVPGRPFLYGTTKLFLEYFGLKSLKDLPKLEDVNELLRSAGGGDGPSGIFDSNQAVTMEDAVADFGGEDHLTQSFAREGTPEMFEEDEEESGEDFSQGADEQPQNDLPVEAVEEAEDLKRVMDEMSQ
jgi:segregation and condensation protein B